MVHGQERCFCPAPVVELRYRKLGYDNKARLGDTDLLTKEKQKEKKHKDKKDKEKREGKERKKDKERSDRKHKEKKERKEKHKDHKDKDRDNKKKNIVGQSEGQNGEKLVPKFLQNGDTMDPKFLVELGKRIKDEGGARENQMFQSITVTFQKSRELPGRVVEINIGNLTEGKELFKNKGDGDRNVDGQRNHVEARGMENGFVPGFSGTDQKRTGGAAGPVDKDVRKQREQKKKHECRDGDSRGDRRKGSDNGKTSKPNDRDRTKDKEKEPNKEQYTLRESSKNGIDSHNIEPPHLLKEGNKSSTCNVNLGKRKELERNGFAYDDSICPHKLPRLISSPHQLVQNGRKLELHQPALQLACERQAAAATHKVEGKFSSCHQIQQNGRKLEPNPTAIQSGSLRHGAANSSKTHKDAGINGLIDSQQPNARSSKPSSTSSRAKEKVEACVKLPHPDSKYLSRILSVPEVAGWSVLDDQEWLFSNDRLLAEKPKTGPLEVAGTPQVWAQAFRIESMDVIALPYVIPF